MREYGLERLVEDGEEAETRNQHAVWYVAFAERAAPLLGGADQERWFRRVEAESEIVFSKKAETFQIAQGILSPLRLPSILPLFVIDTLSTNIVSRSRP